MKTMQFRAEELEQALRGVDGIRHKLKEAVSTPLSVAGPGTMAVICGLVHALKEPCMAIYSAAPLVNDDGYVILSLKWSPSHEGNAVWWRPEISGYTINLADAGVYTQQDIDDRPLYYNDRETAVAVPFRMAKEVERTESMVSWNKARKLIDDWKTFVNGEGTS